MQLPEKLRSRSFQRKTVLGILVFLIVFSITGFFILPPIVKSVLVKNLSKQFRRQVTIQKVKINPFMLSGEIRGVAISERNGSKTFISFDSLYMNAQAMSIIKRGLILREIRLTRPYINISRDESGGYNFSDLLEPAKKPSGPPGKLPRFSLNNIQIIDGNIDFWDGPENTRHTVKKLNVAIPFISDLPYFAETYAQPLLEASVNGKPVALKGKTKPFADSHETSFNVEIKDLDIPYYLAYVPFPFNFSMPSGRFDANVVIAYTQYAKRPPTLTIEGTTGVREFSLTEKNGEQLLKLPSVTVKIAPSEVLSRAVHLAGVLVESAELNVVRGRNGSINLGVLTPASKQDKTPVPKEKEGPALSLLIDDIALRSGTFFVTDSPAGGSFKTTLKDIDLKVAGLSTKKDAKAALTLSFNTDFGESFKADAAFSLDPSAADGTVELSGVAIQNYKPYYRDLIRFGIEKGTLDLKTGFSVSKTGDVPEIRLTGLGTTLSSLRLKKEEESATFMSVPLLRVSDASLDMTTRELAIGEIFTEKGVINGLRTRETGWNLMNLFPAASEQPGGSKGRIQIQAEQKTKSNQPWVVAVGKVGVENYAVRIEDRTTADKASISADKIRMRASNLSTVKGRKGKASLSLALNKKGSISVGGQIGIVPPTAELAVDAKGIDIEPFVPYFEDKVKIMINSGAVGARGTVTFTDRGKEGIVAGYKGEASVTNFHSVDKTNFDDFLKWDSLHLSGIQVKTEPLLVVISDVALADFYSRLIINKDGSLNVQGIVTEQAQPAAGAQEAAAAKTEQSSAAQQAPAGKKLIQIGTVTLQGGTVNFTDNHIEPNYNANLVEIGGRVTGLTSEESKFADVDLKGKIDNYAPLEITGKVNPLRDDLYVDLKADFRDMDLSPVTPYSGRYIGYTIQKGNLTLQLQYLIVKNKLDAQNKVFLDQFTLGEKVESPEATKLPVKLAIALLKNRKGEIKLDIPVSGYINDPKFSLGRIIIKILVNLLVKAATSPFALLGAVFGGGEELSYVEFDYGLTAIKDSEGKKIETLLKALADRPALKLEIEGHVDPEKDHEGLRQYIFQKKIKAQKLKDMVKKGQQPVPVDDIKIEPAEYPVYLKKAYKEEKFPKPRNIIGIAKDLPVPEMEKLMLTHIEVKEQDLRTLASQRALVVKERLIQSKMVESDRMFLVEPKSLAPEPKENLRQSRVDFRLK